jgi:AcrR family transcriptional regulator
MLEELAAGADRRTLILDAARDVVCERGVDAARMADIAERAGVSLGLVQHYFRHRDRLLAEVFSLESERITVRWRNLVDPDDDPLIRLFEYLKLVSREGTDPSVRSFRLTWSLWLEFWSKANRDAELRGEVAIIYREFSAPFAEAITEGIERGMFAPKNAVPDVVDRLVSLIDGLAIRTLLGAMDQHRMLALLVDCLCLELGVPDEEAKRLRQRL